MEDILVADVIVHEYYMASSITQENDLALIRLQHAAPYADHIQPICLPVGELRNKNYDLIPMIVAGFGRNEFGNVKLVNARLVARISEM